MPQITFFIDDKDKTGVAAGIPRSHPHEAVLKKSNGAYKLFFKNRLDTMKVQVTCDPLGIDVTVAPGGQEHVTLDPAGHEGAFGCTLTPIAALCCRCGQALPDDLQVKAQSGASRDGDNDGDPIIIIDPAA